MLLEVRLYKIRDEVDRATYIEFFEGTILPYATRKGMKVLGQFWSAEGENTFVWLRSFESMEARKQVYEAYYESDEWKETIGPKARSMVESTNIKLVEPTALSAIA